MALEDVGPLAICDPQVALRVLTHAMWPLELDIRVGYLWLRDQCEPMRVCMRMIMAQVARGLSGDDATARNTCDKSHFDIACNCRIRQVMHMKG